MNSNDCEARFPIDRWFQPAEAAGDGQNKDCHTSQIHSMEKSYLSAICPNCNSLQLISKNKKRKIKAWTFLNHKSCRSVRVPASVLNDLGLDPKGTCAHQKLLRHSIVWINAFMSAACVEISSS